jgi:hypothetical protein
LKASDDITQDSVLVGFWEEWKLALHDSLATSSTEISKAAHARAVEIEKSICATPAEGLLGIAVQLALWLVSSSADESEEGNAAALAAYRSVVHLTGRDRAAEGDAIFESPDDKKQLQ